MGIHMDEMRLATAYAADTRPTLALASVRAPSQSEGKKLALAAAQAPSLGDGTAKAAGSAIVALPQ